MATRKPRRTIAQQLQELATEEIPAPFKQKYAQVRKISQEMSDDARKLGLSLDFTPDGRFIGDLGEAIAAVVFNVRLHPTLKGAEDGRCGLSNKSVEVKARTESSTIWVKTSPQLPDILLVLYVSPTDLRWGVVYNGPATVVREPGFGKDEPKHVRITTTISQLLKARQRLQDGTLPNSPMAIRRIP